MNVETARNELQAEYTRRRIAPPANEIEWLTACIAYLIGQDSVTSDYLSTREEAA